MYDLVIIGAGPSGLMCSISTSVKKVLIVDKNDQIGGKIKVSGGGRCNVTTSKTHDELLKTVVGNEKFLYPCLKNFNQFDIYNMFNNNGCLLKEEDHNRIFPITGKSQTIIDFFKKQLLKHNVETLLNYSVKDIQIKDYGFLIDNHIKTKHLVFATGGVTYQNMGTTGDGHQFCKTFGHKITDLYPCESPLVSNDFIIQSKIYQGITLKDVSCKILINNKVKMQITNNVLFTHFGLSGPASLHSSSLIKKSIINNKKVIFRIMLDSCDIPKKMSEIKENYLDINIVDTKGFKIAFLTGGGVSLKEIDPKTYQSKLIKNLYIIGELTDINCFTGGNNLTVFMSQGKLCGQNIK